MKLRAVVFALLCALLAGAPAAAADESEGAHPRLLLSAQVVEAQGENWRNVPRFAASINAIAVRLKAHLQNGIDVPVPKDAGGGYTHEQHKQNGIAIHDAGLLYQWTKDPQHLKTARELLFAYADLYPTLGEHPRKKEQTPGRLFWQSLNEAVWLLYAIQGYDAVLPALSADERARIEGNLFRPLAAFLSTGQPQTFNKIHNHGTWATAAVGMTGYVLNESELVEQALLGLARDGEGGFLRQLDELFSPDGYYTEGPYYQRYALMPYVVFARAIEHNQPQRRIFEHREGILLRAIHTTIQLSYAGLFFPLNDAITDKGLDTIELDYGIAIAYGRSGDARLLSLLRDESKILVPTDDGLRAAEALARGEARPYQFESRFLRDGAAGDEGALTVLRSGAQPGHAALVFKATAHGLGHGHFDRLNWLFFENGNEVVADYGAARFLNIEQKNGGHYLPENKSYAKQSVAHNTLVVDETSQFDANVQAAEAAPPRILFVQLEGEVQAVAARENAAWPGVQYDRALAMVSRAGEGLAPLVLDIARVRGARAQNMDAPLWYRGQFIASAPEVQAATDALLPLGGQAGYQHLWRRGAAELSANAPYQFTWLLNGRFYTWNVIADAPVQIVHAATGANDPNFNLRHETALLLRAEDVQQLNWTGLLEAHGEYNGAREFTVGNRPAAELRARVGTAATDLVLFTDGAGAERVLAIAWDSPENEKHRGKIGGKEYAWSGPFKAFCKGPCNGEAAP